MKKKWKRISALCLAVLLGCLVPAGTMKAAEEDQSVLDSDAAFTLQTEQTPDAEEVLKTDETSGEAQTGNKFSDEIMDEETDETISESGGKLFYGLIDEVTDEAEDLNLMPYIAVTANQNDNNEVPVSGINISVMYQGNDITESLGGAVNYDLYIAGHDQGPSISVEQAGDTAALYYYLDTSGADTSLSYEELDYSDIVWEQTDPHNVIKLEQDGKYVLYVRVKQDDEAFYAVSRGIVVDTAAPRIIAADGSEIQDGGSYPVGTEFTVEDANPDVVLINEQPVAPVDGKYQIIPGSWSVSCVIRAIDKAGHETVRSVSVFATAPPPEEVTVINKNGNYELKCGTGYRLGEGNYMIKGDPTVYQGGSTFYVKEDGKYHFKNINGWGK